jgi:hypothetical protein
MELVRHSNIGSAMSLLGHKLPMSAVRATSALPLKATESLRLH